MVDKLALNTVPAEEFQMLRVFMLWRKLIVTLLPKRIESSFTKSIIDFKIVKNILVSALFL